MIFGSLGSTTRRLLKLLVEVKELFLRWSLREDIPLETLPGFVELVGLLVCALDGRACVDERLDPRTGNRTNLVLIEVVRL